MAVTGGVTTGYRVWTGQDGRLELSGCMVNRHICLGAEAAYRGLQDNLIVYVAGATLPGLRALWEGGKIDGVGATVQTDQAQAFSR